MAEGLELTIKQTREEVAFRLAGDRAEHVRLRLHGPWRVRDRSRRFIEKVNARKSASRMDPAAALKVIEELSRAAFSTLARSCDELYSDVSQAWNEVTWWLHRSPASRLGEPPRTTVSIEVHSDEYLPWEWLGPVAEADGPPVPERREEESALVATASRLLGMTLCSRYYSSPVHPAAPDGRGALRPLAGSLQVRGFFDQSLPTASREVAYFRDDRYRLVGPLPDGERGFGHAVPDTAGSEIDIDLVKSFVAHLYDPAHPGADGEPVGGVDEAVHFCCHHLPGGGDLAYDAVPSSELRFGRDLVIDTDLVEEALAEWWGRHPTSRPQLPLVFLNLCGGEVQPGTLASLSRLFHSNRNPTVVSTTAAVTDRVATTFMRRFYDHYRASRTAAEALWLAKYALLQSPPAPGARQGPSNNPFGLLYTLSGDGSLRVVDSTAA